MLAVSSRSLTRTILFATAIAIALLAFTAARSSAAYTITDFKLTPSPLPTPAGGHPSMHYHVDPDANAAGSDDLKKVVLDFPAGLLGNPEAASPKCVATGTGTANKFSYDACPASSYIGSMLIKWKEPLGNLTSAPGSVYVLSPATAGSVATIGFIVRPQGWRKIFLKTEVNGIVTVRTDSDYGLTLAVDNIPRVLTSNLGLTYPITLSDIAVDINSRAGGTSVTSPNGPYFTFNPTRCDAATTRASINSYGSSTTIVKSSSYTPTDCANVKFEPTANVVPTVTTPGAPTGVNATFGIPTADAPIQQSHVKNIQVDLPTGTGLNFPAIGAVPALCTDAQLTADTCPAGAKIGTVSAAVPFLPPTMTGDVYLLTRNSSITFGYILRGANGVKAPLKGSAMAVDVDGDGGADLVRAYASTMPQVPWTTASINFTSKLINNPATACGAAPTQVKTTLNGWSGATRAVTNAWPGYVAATNCNPPVVAITSPANNSTTASATTNVAFTVNGGTTIPSGTACTVKGVATTTTQTNSVALVLGSNPITVACTNSAGTGTAFVNVNRLVPPPITITTPANGTNTTASTISVSFLVNGSSTIPAGTTCTQTGAAITSTTNTAPLVIGANTIVVTCTNAAGTSSATVTVNRGVAPVVTITSPVNGSTPPGSSVSVTWTVTGTQPITCTLNGAAATSPATVNLQLGSNTIVVTCTNAFGSDTKAITFIPPTSPVVTITSPSNNSTTTNTSIPVTWTVTGGTPITCTVNGAAATSPATVLLVSGTNTIAVTCTNAFGSDTKVVTVTRGDTIAPTISGLSSSQGSGGATITYSATDNSGATPTCTPASGTTFAFNTGGTLMVTVYCRDAAGNTANATLNITHTGTGLGLISTINTGPNGNTTSATPTFAYSVNRATSGPLPCSAGQTCANVTVPLVAFSCTVDGAFVACGEGSFTTTSLPLGKHTFCVSARGIYSGEASPPTCRTFTVIASGGTPPVVTITSPPSGGFYGGSPVNIAYQVDGSTTIPAGTTCTVNGVASTTPGANSTVIPTGTNAIPVTCSNSSGSDTKVVTFTNGPGFLVAITSPLPNSQTSSATVNVEYNRVNVDYSSVTCTINGVPSTSNSFNSVALPLGTSSIDLVCRGGNDIATSSVTVTRGNPPAVAITAPANNSSATGSTNVSYTVDGSASIPAGTACRVNGVNSTSTSTNAFALASGANLITVSCSNAFGATTATITVNGGGSTPPPTVQITAPTAYPTTNPFNVSYTVNGAPSIPAGTTCTVNGSASSSATTNSVARPIGTVSVVVACTNVGGTGSAVASFQPPTAPLVIITAPVNNSWTGAAVTNVAYSASGSTPMVCTVNGVTSTSTTTNPVALVAGPNTITVTCSNSFGSDSKSITVNRDNIAPTIGQISVSTPNLSGYVTISYSATDNSGIAPTCNPPSGSQFYVGGGGSVAITVTCTDLAGNSATASIFITGTGGGGGGLAVTLTSAPPAPPATTSDDTPSFSWVANQPESGPYPCAPGQTCIQIIVPYISYTCSMDGASVPCSGNSYTSPALPQGQHTFCVAAHGVYSGQNSAPACSTFTIVIGGSPPVSTITSPVNGSVTSASSTNVTWTAAGTTPIGCTLNGNAATSPATVPLLIGANTITVVCTNPYGSSTMTVTVTVTRVATASFAPTFNQTFSSTLAGTSTDLHWSISNLAGAEGIRKLRVNQDPAISPNFPAFGNPSTDTCPSAGSTTTSFVVSSCPAQARIGTVSINSANYGSPLTGYAYFINAVPVPRIGIDVSASIPGNPSGVSFQMVISTLISQTDPLCDPSTAEEGYCPNYMAMTIQDIPNIGVTGMTVDLGGVSRSGPLPTHPFFISPPGCQPGTNLSTSAQFTGWSAATAVVNDSDLLTCPPQGPSISVTNPTTSWTQAASVTLTYTVDPGAGDTPVCNIASGTVIPLTTGANTIAISCTNSTGTATRTVSIGRDNQVPVIAITSPAANSYYNGSAAPNLLYTVTDDLDTAPQCTPAQGPITGLVQGANVITVTCTDHADNTATASRVINFDSIVPTVSANCTGAAVFTCTFAASESATFTCKIDGGPATSCTSPFTTPSLVVDMQHTITFCATDQAGNTGCTVVTVGSDYTPFVNITQYAKPAAAAGGISTVTFTPATAECRVDAGPYAACSSPWTIPTSGLSSPAEHTYDIRTNSQSTSPTRGYIWIDSRGYTATSTVAPQSNSLTAAGAVTNAGAHPDISAAVTVVGADDARNVSIQFPDGLMGSLSSVPVASRCSSAQATAGTCPASSQIGTISGTMEFARGGVTTATGTVYMVDSAGLPSQYAAGTAISMTNIPGGHGDLNVLGNLELVDASRAVRLTTTDLPRQTSNNDTFHLLSGTVTIKGDTGGAASPLITNPHFCGPFNTNRRSPGSPTVSGYPAVTGTTANNFFGRATSWEGNTTPEIQVPYNVVNCAALPFNPSMSVAISNPAAGGTTALNVNLSLPFDSSTVRSTILKLPPFMAPNFPAFGIPDGDQCAAGGQPTGAFTTSASAFGTAAAAYRSFSNATCPPQSIIGSAILSSPLLPQTLKADIYLSASSPIPALGIYVDPAKYGNLQGVKIGLYSLNATPQLDLLCDPATSETGDCPTQIQATLSSTPDVPVTSIALTLGGMTGRALGADALSIATPADPACVNAGSAWSANLNSWSSTTATVRSGALAPTGCNQ
jgi:hypothetical protein